jgi:hypothetical protein
MSKKSKIKQAEKKLKIFGTVIKDEDLQEYLEGKLTTKPDYGFDTEVKGTLTSRWLEAQEKEKAIRLANNKRNTPYRGY